MIVQAELDKMGIKYSNVNIGEADINEKLSSKQKDELNVALIKTGLILIDDHKNILVEKIKIVIIDLVYNTEAQIKINLSDYLSEKLNYDYTYLANFFKEVMGNTIEQFFILHRIERVKELVAYHELNFTEIANNLHYSSVAHLSNQFKKTTGITLSHFKKLKLNQQ